MDKEQLHGYISESGGNESNICRIYAIKDGNLKTLKYKVINDMLLMVV